MAEVAASAHDAQRSIGFLGLMRSRNYALLWWGQLVSEMGNRFHWIAVSLWVYAFTGSAAAVSLAVSSMFIGSLLFGLWAGALVDRLNRKTILVASDLARGVLVALIPALMGTNVWLVYADLALVSLATAFFRPAMFAVVPQVVTRRDLMPANSFFTAMDTGTEIAGPALAGLLAFRFGYALLLYIDAASYIVSALCIVGMSLGPVTAAAVGRLREGSVWRDVVEGLRYVRQERLQWGLFVLIFPAYLVGSGLNALQTPLAKGIIGITDAEFGTFSSVWGVGFVSASLILAWFGARIRKSRLILGGFFLGFASTAAMGLSNSFNTLLAGAFAVGFSNTLNYVGLTTVLMEYTPQEFIGRVVSMRQVALGSTRIISPLIFGALADIWDVRWAILSMAIVGAVGTATIAVLNPILRRFDASAGPARGSINRILDYLIRKTNPEFDKAQQVTLNSASIAVALLMLAVLAYHVPAYAAGALVTVVGLATLGGKAMSLLWPARAEHSIERLFADVWRAVRSWVGRS